MEERYLAAKAKIEKLSNNNEDLYKMILDVMNKVSESEKLWAEAEENSKAITERKKALEKEVRRWRKPLQKRMPL